MYERVIDEFEQGLGKETTINLICVYDTLVGDRMGAIDWVLSLAFVIQ